MPPRENDFAADQDPYQWLEEVESQAALEWAENHSQQSAVKLKAHPQFDPIYQSNREIFNSAERIPAPQIRGDFIYNFWQDAQHRRGLWRRTELASYCSDDPLWEIVLDLDELAHSESEDWVWKGATWLAPQWDRCMVQLSRGGADAAQMREFDLPSKQFVADGFTLPQAKSWVYWRERDTLVVGTDFGPGSLTASGYPRQARIWRRGTDLALAPLLYEAAPSDMGLWGYIVATPEGPCEFIRRSITFFTGEYHAVVGDGLVELDIPDDAELSSVFKGQVLVHLKSAWSSGDTTFPQGALISAPHDQLVAGRANFQVVRAPDPRSSIADTAATRDALLVDTLVDVDSQLFEYRLLDGQWQGQPLDLPDLGSIYLAGAEATAAHYFVWYSNFLTPQTLYMGDHSGQPPRSLKSLPAFFDAAPYITEQFHAPSADGTKIPYFLVRNQSLAYDGANPTLLYGYGGFEISMRPHYSPAIGRNWLDRGGVYVVANIRGGGEFGPAWHHAALKEKRQCAFDDFIAVAQDLIARQITAPAHLGIMGGSNGGLLVGAAFTQRPELFGAVACGVPLLDMRRYNKLLAGASWMAEYGDPDVPEEWAYIRQYSPYHKLATDRQYPQVFFYTSTRDDRVHPGHARKMVARMEAMGHPVLYYENTKGGHAAAADNEERAFMDALTWSYLLESL